MESPENYINSNDPTNPSLSDYLNGLREDDLIHRYCSIAELYNIIRKRLTLTCPFAWEDLFENPLMRANLTNSKGEDIDLKAAGRKLFCQSWTLNDESDAMWKLYGNHGLGVRISTQAKALFFQAYNSYDVCCNDFVLTKIGKVEYLDEQELKSKFDDESEFKERFMRANCDGYYESLLYKRKAYSSEKEVRLIAHDFDGRFHCPTTLRLELPIREYGWIDSVAFGPAIDNDSVQAHRSMLIQLGFPEHKIQQSKLYGKLVYSIAIKD